MASHSGYCTTFLVIVVLFMCLMAIVSGEPKSQNQRVRKSLLNPIPNWRPDVCYPNRFEDIIDLFVKRGIRWKNPKLKAYDLRIEDLEKRKELLHGLLDLYCEDEDTDEEVVEGLDECFSIAFRIDHNVTTYCRKKTFILPAEIRAADCSDQETKEAIDFRKCINEKMREINASFDLYDHAKSDVDREKRERVKYLRADSLYCLRDVMWKYVDDLQDEYDWPLWGSDDDDEDDD